MMGFGMMGGGFLGLLLIGVVIYLIVSNGNSASGGYKSNNSLQDNHALDILKERYAKGEISDEEYERKRKMLKD